LIAICHVMMDRDDSPPQFEEEFIRVRPKSQPDLELNLPELNLMES
jgi:hypothetical protein